MAESKKDNAAVLTSGIAADLMPLVADGIASQESEAALKRHLEQCEECRVQFGDMQGHVETPAETFPQDQKIMAYIRKRSLYLMSFILLLGAAAGVTMVNTSLVFQNFLIMPAVGALSFCCFGRKGLWVTLLIMGMSVIRGLLGGLVLGEWSDMAGIIIYGVIFAALAVIGHLIAALLAFAFRKE